MKHIINPLKYLAVTALLALAVGCATEQQSKQNMAVAAGFKVITPKNAVQGKILQSLPAEQVTHVTYKGNKYWVLPDVKNNQAYVGRDKEYQAYQQLRLEQHLSNQNLEAAQMNQMASMHSNNWDAWGGWGGGYGGRGGRGGWGW